MSKTFVRNVGNLHPVDEFACSGCGIFLSGWYRVHIDEETGDETHCEYEFKYCPECGAEVTENE